MLSQNTVIRFKMHVSLVLISREILLVSYLKTYGYNLKVEEGISADVPTEI